MAGLRIITNGAFLFYEFEIILFQKANQFAKFHWSEYMLICEFIKKDFEESVWKIKS